MDGLLSSSSDFTRVRGRVFVLKKDRRFRIVHLGLRLPDGEVLLVLDTPISEFLRDFIGEEVIVSGDVILDGADQPCIKVQGFDPVEVDEKAYVTWMTE